MKEKTIPALQLAGTLLILGAMHIWAPVCTGLLDLTTGRQMHMKCWFSMQAATMVCIVLVVVLAVMMTLDTGSRKKMQAAVLTAAVVMPLIFGKVIGICMKTDMSCHATFRWIIGLSIVIGVLGAADILRGGKNQLPD